MHNHVFGETPRIVYMHIEAHGDAVQRAAAVRTALQQSKAPIDVLRANEVNPVSRALRAANIAMTALHSHMLTEEPRLFFRHFWAVDDAAALARGLRAALDQTASTTGPST